jgi:hypothetical protein
VLFEEIVLTFLGYEVELEVENFLLGLLIDGHGLDLTEKRRLFSMLFCRGLIFERMLAHKVFEGKGIGHITQPIILFLTNLIQLVAISLRKLIEGATGFIDVLEKVLSFLLLIHCFRGNL